jgi:hypothetical protein
MLRYACDGVLNEDLQSHRAGPDTVLSWLSCTVRCALIKYIFVVTQISHVDTYLERDQGEIKFKTDSSERSKYKTTVDFRSVHAQRPVLPMSPIPLSLSILLSCILVASEAR